MVLILAKALLLGVLSLNDGIRVVVQAFREHGYGNTIYLSRVGYSRFCP